MQITSPSFTSPIDTELPSSLKDQPQQRALIIPRAASKTSPLGTVAALQSRSL